jgi:hypothetical protein
LRNDKDLALIALKRDGILLKYVSENLKNDKELVLTAISKDASSI